MAVSDLVFLPTMPILIWITTGVNFLSCSIVLFVSCSQLRQVFFVSHYFIQLKVSGDIQKLPLDIHTFSVTTMPVFLRSNLWAIYDYVYVDWWFIAMRRIVAVFDRSKQPRNFYTLRGFILEILSAEVTLSSHKLSFLLDSWIFSKNVWEKSVSPNFELLFTESSRNFF